MARMTVGPEHAIMYQQQVPDFRWDLGQLCPYVQAFCSCGWQSEEYLYPTSVEAEVAEHFQDVKYQG